jgi:hypothetical protein
VDQITHKPVWVDALEESLLLAIAVVSVIVWIALFTIPG